MDNVIHAIFLAFAMFALVIGLSFGMYLLGNLNSVATTLINANDKTKDYQSVSFNSSSIVEKGSLTPGSQDTKLANRFVSADVVVSTIYRYYKENFAVEIYNSSGELNQIFDLEIDNVLSSKNDKDKYYEAYSSLYGNGSQPAQSTCELFGAPWVANHNLIKQRIDLYVSSQKGYIGSTLVDYQNNGFSKLIAGNKNVFTEQFIQYTYDGETLSVGDGEDIETITKSRKEQKKIIIRYIQHSS